MGEGHGYSHRTDPPVQDLLIKQHDRMSSCHLNKGLGGKDWCDSCVGLQSGREGSATVTNQIPNTTRATIHGCNIISEAPCRVAHGLQAKMIPKSCAIFAVAEDTGAELRQTRQYLYFCTSKCVSICTFVLVNPSDLGVGEPDSCVSICAFVLVKQVR